MITAIQILQSSGITHHPFRTIYMTDGGQLMGSFIVMKRFQQTMPEYHGWHAHHIFETFDLDRLGVTAKFADRDDQLCVLLPERAHVGRINSILRVENPVRYSATAEELLPAYRRAYALVGNYCGGGEATIQRELMAIVSEVLKQAGFSTK